MAQVTRLDWIARLGFLARAIVYVLLGAIALQARWKADEGQNAVFEALRDMPAGAVLLIATGAGLAAYGLYRLATAFLDLDRKGSRWKGLAERAGQLVSGVAHLVLAATAFAFTSRLRQPHHGDKGPEAAETLLGLPLGPVLLGLVGLYFLIVAGSQAVKAVRASFMDEIAPDAPPLTRILGRIGHAARAAVFAVIGWSMIRAAWLEDEDQARAIGGALAELRQNDPLYVAVAAGLIVFGVFSLLLARYRIVPRIDVAAAAKGVVAAKAGTG